MFIYNTKALALSILTLGASCSLYSMQDISKTTKVGTPTSELPEKELSHGEKAQLSMVIMKESSSFTLPVAIDSATKKPSVLLLSMLGGSWTAIPQKTENPSEAGELLSLITIGKGKTAQHPFANLDFSKATSEKMTEGHLKNKPVYIAPINFIPAESIKMGEDEEAEKIAKALNPEFVWIPVDEFVSHMTVVARPLSTMGLTGKPNLANVDYSINQFIKTNANKIKATTAQPLPKIEAKEEAEGKEEKKEGREKKKEKKILSSKSESEEGSEEESGEEQGKSLFGSL